MELEIRLSFSKSSEFRAAGGGGLNAQTLSRRDATGHMNADQSRLYLLLNATKAEAARCQWALSAVHTAIYPTRVFPFSMYTQLRRASHINTGLPPYAALQETFQHSAALQWLLVCVCCC
jgi:hypothetical protein